MIKTSKLNEDSWLMLQITMEHGGVSITHATMGIFNQDLSVVDMLEGPLWMVSWKDEYRAIIRTRDAKLAWYAGVEFASNGGSPFAVVDIYDWSSNYEQTKSGKTVTTKELSIKLLDLELASKLNISLSINHLFSATKYLKQIEDIKTRYEQTHQS